MLKHSYTLFAPFYDLLLEDVSRSARRRSLEDLVPTADQTILISGIGTGLDLPLLPATGHYIGIDLTRAMLRKAKGRRHHASINLCQGDCMRLPFADHSFDWVIMHLILAVVPHPEQALREATRVLKPNGRILILDKFLRRGQRAYLRRLISPVLGKIATRTNVELEPLLEAHPELQVCKNQSALLGGWFRQVVLKKSVQGGGTP